MEAVQLMSVDRSEPNQIILIGPCGAGKSTMGKLLAEQLDSSFVSLDGVDRQYMVPAGFDPARAKELWQSGVPFAGYNYGRMFYDAAVVGFLADYPEGVLELGGGHPIIPDRDKQARVIEALRPYNRVVLLLPTMDLRASVERLRERRGIATGKPDLNNLYIADDTFFALAKVVITTEGRTPEETCAEVLTALGIGPAPRPDQR
jgi:shikimate kinase